VHVGKLLGHRPIGIAMLDDGVAELRYGQVVLGYFDDAAPSTQLLTRPPARTLESWDWTV